MEASSLHEFEEVLAFRVEVGPPAGLRAKPKWRRSKGSAWGYVYVETETQVDGPAKGREEAAGSGST